MSEVGGVESAHRLLELQEEHRRQAAEEGSGGSGEEGTPHRRWHELIELGEVLILALVAVVTAWSGYQAAKWDGHQSLLYGQASRDRFQADSASTLAGQELLGNLTLFTAWLQATQAGSTQLAALYVKRMTPDYRIAFDAWLRTNPLTDPSAPPGPSYMTQYRNPLAARAEILNQQASATFDEGSAARDTAEKYVRDTVLFASVLFLVALAQRLKARRARLGLLGVATALLVYVTASVIGLPRI